jgi:hypothetical protein
LDSATLWCNALPYNRFRPLAVKQIGTYDLQAKIQLEVAISAETAVQRHDRETNLAVAVVDSFPQTTSSAGANQSGSAVASGPNYSSDELIMGLALSLIAFVRSRLRLRLGA